MLPSRCIFLPFESCLRVLSKVLISVCAITIVYITKKTYRLRELLHKWAWYFHRPKESENTAHHVMSMMCTLTSVYYPSQHINCVTVSHRTTEILLSTRRRHQF